MSYYSIVCSSCTLYRRIYSKCCVVSMARERVGGYRFANAFSMSKNDSKWNWVEVPGRHSNHPKKRDAYTHTHREISLWPRHCAHPHHNAAHLFIFAGDATIQHIHIFISAIDHHARCPRRAQHTKHTGEHDNSARKKIKILVSLKE